MDRESFNTASLPRCHSASAEGNTPVPRLGTVLAFLIAQISVSAVKEVTGVASSALAPATLAGRGVIELTRADARMFTAGRTFLPRGPEDLATLGVWQCPLALLRKELSANSAKPLITVLTAPFRATRRYKIATRLFGFVSLRRLKRGYSCLYLNVAYPGTLLAVRQVLANEVRHHRSQVFTRDRVLY